MTLEEARATYPNEWIAFRMDTKGDNPVGEVVLHNRDRAEFEHEWIERKIRNVYVTFNGAIVPEGYVAMF
jgi:hypothetical protein